MVAFSMSKSDGSSKSRGFSVITLESLSAALPLVMETEAASALAVVLGVVGTPRGLCIMDTGVSNTGISGVVGIVRIVAGWGPSSSWVEEGEAEARFLVILIICVAVVGLVMIVDET